MKTKNKNKMNDKCFICNTEESLMYLWFLKDIKTICLECNLCFGSQYLNWKDKDIIEFIEVVGK